ncbi:MAG: YcfL family protein [Verrucomicrobia bacterium]|nr:YcfL family protein [Verrucomicrobiota bacterium]
MKPIQFLFVLAGAAVLTGCSTTVNTVERAQPVGERAMISDKRIITDRSLDRAVRIVGLSETQTPEGAIKIQVEVANATRAMKSFSYKVEWFDANGVLVDTPATASITRQIEGKESLFITAVAPTATVKDFRFKFMELP